jgi:GNAT superfamily N-acetyltransferase
MPAQPTTSRRTSPTLPQLRTPSSFDGARIVGAATGAPLGGHTVEFVPLFEHHGYDPARIFYCGESVLLPDYRGSGIGHIFFDRREAHARACTGPHGPYTHVAFCVVIRPPDDPRRPANYVPLDAFWRKRGYAPIPGLIGSYSWREIGAEGNKREIGAEEESKKPMQFWMRALTP